MSCYPLKSLKASHFIENLRRFPRKASNLTRVDPGSGSWRPRACPWRGPSLLPSLCCGVTMTVHFVLKTPHHDSVHHSPEALVLGFRGRRRRVLPGRAVQLQTMKHKCRELNSRSTFKHKPAFYNVFVLCYKDLLGLTHDNCITKRWHVFTCHI